MHCKNCRFWHLGDQDELYPITSLRSLIDRIPVGCCQHQMVIQPEYGERNNKEMTTDGVLTCDEGGYTGELMTGPMFGCIHFAEVEKEESE